MFRVSAATIHCGHEPNTERSHSVIVEKENIVYNNNYPESYTDPFRVVIYFVQEISKINSEIRKER
jgi:hypothetical protein